MRFMLGNSLLFVLVQLKHLLFSIVTSMKNLPAKWIFNQDYSLCLAKKSRLLSEAAFAVPEQFVSGVLPQSKTPGISY